MRPNRYDYDNDSDGFDATETSGLLGNGTRENGYDGERIPDETTGEDSSSKDKWDGLRDFQGLPWWKTPSVYWLVGPYALFMLAYGGTLVPKFNLILSLVCRRYLADQALLDPSISYTPISLGDDNPQCGQIPEVQRMVASFTLMVSVIVGALSAFSAPRLGAMSDIVGRKPILIIASCGGIVMEIATILAAKFPDVVSYKWLLLGAAADGLSGSITLGGIMSQSYTSDCTAPSRRAVSIGYLHACLFGGMALGPLLAGFLVKATGELLFMFYIALGCHIFFIFFIMLVLPESLSKRTRQLSREKHAKQQRIRDAEDEALLESLGQSGDDDATPWLRSLRRRYTIALATFRRWNPLEPLKILMPTGPGTAPARRNLIILAVIDACLLATMISSGQVVLLYIVYMFKWGNFETSLLVSGMSMVRVVVLAGIFPIINYIFRVRPAKLRRQRELLAAGLVEGENAKPLSERNAGPDNLDLWVLRVALLSDVLGVVGYIFVRTGPLFCMSAAVTALGGLASATLQASLTKMVSPNRVGELLGATGFLHASSRIVAPMIFNGVYYATIESYPQGAFVLIFSIFIVLLVMSLFLRPGVYLSQTEEPASGSQSTAAARFADEEALEDEVGVARI